MSSSRSGPRPSASGRRSPTSARTTARRVMAVRRYAAFLRGVSPMNARMPELKRCFEGAGFTNVRTVLSSGNVVFDARKATDATLQRRAESAMQADLDRGFLTIVRPVAFLQELLAKDPYLPFGVPPQAK